ncbi:MAG: hypothetical protein JZU65_24825 [Chlorobium sp.]|nr:hypothetical protein [Chlorobium sp.]
MMAEKAMCEKNDLVINNTKLWLEFVLLLAFIFALLIMFYKETYIFDQSEVILKPYLWFHRDAGIGPDPLQSTLEEGNPFTVTSKLFQEYKFNRSASSAIKDVDRVVTTWNLDRTPKLTYKNGHGKLSPGWWSGMDLTAFPLYLVGVWQDTKNEQMLTMAQQMLTMATKAVSEGGIVWRNEKGCWFSEYAWNGMGAEEEFFVLNGHLHALQSIFMLAKALRDEDLENLYTCGLAATKAYARDFLKKDDPWALYMLSPPTINQTHYVIFEIMQFDALYSLTGEDFYHQEAALRRSLLKRYFPLFLVSESPSLSRSLFLSAIAAPHPYSIDTYPLEVSCERNGKQLFEGSISDPTNTRKGIIDRTFLHSAAPAIDTSAQCRVFSNYAGLKQLLYETNPLNLHHGD